MSVCVYFHNLFLNSQKDNCTLNRSSKLIYSFGQDIWPVPNITSQFSFFAYFLGPHGIFCPRMEFNSRNQSLLGNPNVKRHRKLIERNYFDLGTSAWGFLGLSEAGTPVKCLRGKGGHLPHGYELNIQWLESEPAVKWPVDIESNLESQLFRSNLHSS